MKIRFSRILLLPAILIVGYLVLISYPYFFSKISRFDSLGLLSVIEEPIIDIKHNFRKDRSTDILDNRLLKGEKITAKIKATENNLGILLVRFTQLSAKVTDRIAFRLRQEGESNWYYQNTYRANQFQPNEYFTFGFQPILDSKGKTYIFEVESISGTYNNGIGLSLKKPQVALAYKYTRGDLKNIDKLSSFIFKKLSYVVRNADFLGNWQLLITFALPFFFVLILKKNRILAASSIGSLPSIRKNKRKFFKLIIQKIKSDYLYIAKKITKISKKKSSEFSSTKFYLLFLNTIFKKRLAIGLLIFLLALTYRFSASLVNLDKLFYAGLGGQGDYDQLIRTGTCAVENLCVGILIYNFLLLTPLLGILFKLTGFIGGLKIFLYLMLLLSSAVATLPYIILSRKNWLTFGGLLGSLFLATNDFLTYMALGFPSDNSSVFTFSIFFVVYFLTLSIGTIRWLVIFGLLGIFDGFNKVLFLINDLGALLLFASVFFIEQAKKIKRFPFIKFNLRLLLYSVLPFAIFLIIYLSWEYITYTMFFKSRYFLWQIFFQGGRSWSAYVTSDSMPGQNLLSQLLYISVSAIVMVRRLIEHSGLNMFFLAPIFLGMFILSFVKKKFPMKQLILTIGFSALIITILILVKENFFKIHDIFAGEYILYNWKAETYIGIYLFFAILFLSMLNFKYSAVKFSLPIVIYVGMLVLLAKGAPFARLHTHVVVWSLVLLAFLVDWILLNIKKRIILGPLLLIIFISFYLYPKINTMMGLLSSGLSHYQNELRYLNWVNSELPQNSIILGGGRDDLVTLAENVKKPIIYNTFYAAVVFIPTNRNHREVAVNPAEFMLIKQLRDEENFIKNKHIILEENIDAWRKRLVGGGDGILFSTSSANLLNPEDYQIKKYKFNTALKKGIYELTLH